MLDMKGMREQIDLYKQKLQSGGVAAEVVDELVALDEKRRELIQTSETLKQRRNDVSSTIGEKKRAGELAEELLMWSENLFNSSLSCCNSESKYKQKPI